METPTPDLPFDPAVVKAQVHAAIATCDEGIAAAQELRAKANKSIATLREKRAEYVRFLAATEKRTRKPKS